VKFLVFCAQATVWVFVGALNNEDPLLAWAAAIAFVVFCVAAGVELVWR
jgi:hypothetical protein